MKASQFIASAIGILYSMILGNLFTLILFGTIALISFCRIMEELEEEGEGYWEE